MSTTASIMAWLDSDGHVVGLRMQTSDRDIMGIPGGRVIVPILEASGDTCQTASRRVREILKSAAFCFGDGPLRKAVDACAETGEGKVEHSRAVSIAEALDAARAQLAAALELETDTPWAVCIDEAQALARSPEAGDEMPGDPDVHQAEADRKLGAALRKLAAAGAHPAGEAERFAWYADRFVEWAEDPDFIGRWTKGQSGRMRMRIDSESLGGVYESLVEMVSARCRVGAFDEVDRLDQVSEEIVELNEELLELTERVNEQKRLGGLLASRLQEHLGEDDIPF